MKVGVTCSAILANGEIAPSLRERRSTGEVVGARFAIAKTNIDPLVRVECIGGLIERPVVNVDLLTCCTGATNRRRSPIVDENIVTAGWCAAGVPIGSVGIVSWPGNIP